MRREVSSDEEIGVLRWEAQMLAWRTRPWWSRFLRWITGRAP